MVVGKVAILGHLTEAELREEVEKRLPELVNACKADADTVFMHQDAFAADYQMSEFLLLGMAVKYYGLHGKKVIIAGTNRETLK